MALIKPKSSGKTKKINVKFPEEIHNELLQYQKYTGFSDFGEMLVEISRYVMSKDKEFTKYKNNAIATESANENKETLNSNKEPQSSNATATAE